MPDSQHRIDEAGAGREEHVQHAHQHHGRNEVRRVGGRLRELFQALFGGVVQQQRQNDRQGEPGQQAVEAQRQRILQKNAEAGRTEEVFKVLQSNPRAALNAQIGVKILESDLNAVHGAVAENQQIRRGGQEKEIKEIIGLHLLEHRMTAGLPGFGGQASEGCFFHYESFLSIRCREFGFPSRKFSDGTSGISAGRGFVVTFPGLRRFRSLLDAV